MREDVHVTNEPMSEERLQYLADLVEAERWFDLRKEWQKAGPPFGFLGPSGAFLGPSGEPLDACGCPSMARLDSNRLCVRLTRAKADELLGDDRIIDMSVVDAAGDGTQKAIAAAPRATFLAFEHYQKACRRTRNVRKVRPGA